jgi:hypothetical protein
VAAVRRDFSADRIMSLSVQVWAQNGDGRVRQRRRLTSAPVGDDGTILAPVMVIIYEMLLHDPEKGPHKFQYFSSE